MDEKLMELITFASQQIEGLKWTQRKQPELKEIIELRTEETKQTIDDLIKYIKESF